jgi:hypothetical protein
MEVGPDDFDHSSCDVSPAADPNAASQQEKLMKAHGLMEMLQVAGPIFNPVKVLSRVLEAQEQPNWQELFSDEVIQSGQVPPPPPDPKMMAIQAKMQADQQKAAIDMQVKQQGMELAGRSAEQKMAMEAQAHAQKMQMQEQSAIVKSASDIQMANIFSAAERAKATQGLVQKQQAHEQKLSQQKEVAKSTSKNGAKAK